MFLLALQSSCRSSCLWRGGSQAGQGQCCSPQHFLDGYFEWFRVITQCVIQHDRGHTLLFSHSPGSSIPVELMCDAGVQDEEGCVCSVSLTWAGEGGQQSQEQLSSLSSACSQLCPAVEGTSRQGAPKGDVVLTLVPSAGLSEIPWVLLVSDGPHWVRITMSNRLQDRAEAWLPHASDGAGAWCSHGLRTQDSAPGAQQS